MTSEIPAAAAVQGYHPGHPETPQMEAPAEKRLTSRYRGVCWNRKNKRWQAAINRAGRYIYLGSFREEYDAARAFDRAAVRLKGHQAKLNFNFADYQEDMGWHHQISRMGDTTKIVLDNPKLLRDGLQGPPSNQGMMPVMVRYDMPTFSMGGAVQGFGTTTWTEQPIPGRVIGHAQMPRTVVSVPPVGSQAASMYAFHVPKEQQRSTLSYEKQPMPPNLFSGDGNGMLPPVCGQYNGAAPFFPLREPTVKAEPHTTQPLTPEDRLLPVVNLPDGAELIHVYRGVGDAFASVFVRKNSSVAEVLLYDGRAMHEVGSFLSKSDAAQTCQSLLKILNRVKPDVEPHPAGTPGPCTPGAEQPPRNLESTAIHDVLDRNPVVPALDKPLGKSPFEVAPGKRPSFGSDRAEEIRAYANEEVMIQEAKLDTAVAPTSIPGNYEQDSLAKRMGSLLGGSNDGCIADKTSSIPSLKAVKDCKSEVGTHVYSSLSLVSGSLKNLLAVFNQSGNFSILKKEDDEEDLVHHQIPLMQPQVSFALYDEPIGVSTPKLESPERVFLPNIGGNVNSRADDSADYICDMVDDNGGTVYSKRKFLGEMEEEQAKKRRECGRDGHSLC